MTKQTTIIVIGSLRVKWRNLLTSAMTCHLSASRGVFGDLLVIAPYKLMLWVFIRSFYRAASNEYQQLILYAELGNNIYSYLSFTAQTANPATDKLVTFSYFSQKTYYDIWCKLHEILNIFSGTNKKKMFKMSSAEFFTQHAKR